jgi:hypothetical protein
VGAADIRAFVPLDAEPAEAFVDAVHGTFDEAFLVGVFDAEEKLAAASAGEGPGEEGSTNVADVRVARGAWGIACADGQTGSSERAAGIGRE